MILQTTELKSSVISIDPQARIPGKPQLTHAQVDVMALKQCCPKHAIGVNPVRIDLGKCNFCTRCADLFPTKVVFTDDRNLSTNIRDRLVVIEGDHSAITLATQDAPRTDFDLSRGRFFCPGLEIAELKRLQNEKIRIAASAREAVGIVLTHEISEEQLHTCFHQLLEPKLIILAGARAMASDMMSSGFFDQHRVDLFVPGDPVHPVTLSLGIESLIRGKSK